MENNEVAIFEFGPEEFGVQHLVNFFVQDYFPDRIQSLKATCKMVADMPTALHVAEELKNEQIFVEHGITRYKVSSK